MKIDTTPDLALLSDYIRSAKNAACRLRKKNTVKNALRAAGWPEAQTREFLERFK